MRLPLTGEIVPPRTSFVCALGRPRYAGSETCAVTAVNSGRAIGSMRDALPPVADRQLQRTRSELRRQIEGISPFAQRRGDRRLLADSRESFTRFGDRLLLEMHRERNRLAMRDDNRIRQLLDGGERVARSRRQGASSRAQALTPAAG